MRRFHQWTIALACAGYIIAGSGTAVLAAMVSSPAAVKAWRGVAWLVSLAIFIVHFAIERRRQTGRRGAAYVSVAVALGAAGVAILGPLRAHWAEPGHFRLALLSIIAWPLLTGIPAFIVALTAHILLDRATGTTDSQSHVA